MEVENAFSNFTNFIKRKWRSVSKSEVDPTPASDVPSIEVDSTFASAADAPKIEEVPDVVAAVKEVDAKEEEVLGASSSTEPEIAEAVPTLASAAPTIEADSTSASSDVPFIEATPEVTEKEVDSKEEEVLEIPPSTEPEIVEAAPIAVETADKVDVVVNEEPTTILVEKEEEEEEKMDSIKSEVESTPSSALLSTVEDSTASCEVTTIEAVPEMAEEVESKYEVLDAPSSTEPEIIEAAQTAADAVDDVDVLAANEEPTILLEKEEEEKKTEL